MTLNQLHPQLRPLAGQWLQACQAARLIARITFTYRTPAQQDALYALGRTKPGKVVTELSGMQSKHCFTLPDGTPAAKAFDFSLFSPAGEYITDGTDPAYTRGEIGQDLGLIWGGAWRTFKDYDHLQLST